MKFQVIPALNCALEASGISERDITQCFQNRDGGFLLASSFDSIEHIESAWFVSTTNKLRKIKIVFSFDGKLVSVLSASEADDLACRIYSSEFL